MMMSEKTMYKDWCEGNYRPGSFVENLLKAVSVADQGNLKRLHKGFPDIVNGYCEYTGITITFDNGEMASDKVCNRCEERFSGDIAGNYCDDCRRIMKLD